MDDSDFEFENGKLGFMYFHNSHHIDKTLEHIENNKIDTRIFQKRDYSWEFTKEEVNSFLDKCSWCEKSEPVSGGMCRQTVDH